MKFRKIAFLILTIFTIQIYAQVEKGSIYLSSNSNLIFQSSKTDFSNSSGSISNTNKFSSFVLNSEAGYFLIDNFVAGLNVSLSNVKPENQEARNTYTFSPFVKYYFLEGNLKPFLSFSYGLGKIKDNLVVTGNNFNNVLNKIDTNINVFNAGGGIAYFINKNISLDLIFNYSRTTYNTELPNQNQEQVDKIFQSRFGFSIFL